MVGDRARMFGMGCNAQRRPRGEKNRDAAQASEEQEQGNETPWLTRCAERFGLPISIRFAVMSKPASVPFSSYQRMSSTRDPLIWFFVLPITSTYRGIPSHVPIASPEGSVKKSSYVLCEAVRSIAKERLVHRWGKVNASTMLAVEDRLRILMGL
jgi:mRNA-degrading endonuclease toxin of MazEF toxin-antitoxin module